MKKLALFISTMFIGAGLFAHPDEPIPSDPSGYSWHTVTVVEYKPGSEESARQLIKKFESASVAAGIATPVIHWFETGKYDLVLTWNLDKSPATDKWVWSPEGNDWLNALVAQEGSVESALQLQNDYTALIASSVTNVARMAK